MYLTFSQKRRPGSSKQLQRNNTDFKSLLNSMLLNRIQPEIEKVLRKNQNGFRKNKSTTGQIFTVRRILEGVKARHLEGVLLFVNFSKAFDSVHREKKDPKSIWNSRSKS